MDNKVINADFSKEDAFKTLDIVKESIKHSDNKTAILMGFLVLLVGLTLDVFKSIKIISEWQNIALCVILLILFVLYCTALFSTVIINSLVFLSRYSSSKYNNKYCIKRESVFFFADIDKMGYENYLKKTKSITDSELINDIKNQIVINSTIAKKKALYFNLALLFSLIWFALTIMILILLNI